MTKKKRIIIIVTIIITLGIIFLVLWKNNLIFSSKETNTLIPIKDKDDNTETKDVEINKKSEEYIEKNELGIIIDKKTNNVIYNPKENYPTQAEEPLKIPEEMDGPYVGEYLKYFLFVYPGQSFEKFDDDVIATIVSLSADLTTPKTEGEVARVAEKYFGIKNYELPTGTYNLKNYASYTVTKENGYYVRSEFNNIKKLYITAFPKNLEVNNNHITVYNVFTPYNTEEGMFGCYSPLDPKEECILGYYKIDLTYSKDNNNLIVNKIKYTPNPNYIEPK